MRGTRLGGLVVAAAITLLASGCWYQSGWDPGHSGFNSLESTIGTGNVASLTRRWDFGCDDLSAPIAVASPVIYEPTVDYHCSAAKVPHLISVSESAGTENWDVPLPGPANTPTIGNGLFGGSGLVFLTLTNADGVGELVALHASDGSGAWTIALPGPPIGPPTLTVAPAGVAPSGTGLLYVTTSTHQVVVATTAGVTLETSAASVYSSPPAVGNGLVYVGGTDGSLTALDALSLVPKWTSTVAPSPSQGVVASPALAGGNVYAGSLDGIIAGFNASTGSLVWRNISLAGKVTEAPAVDGGQVFVTEVESVNPPSVGGPSVLYALDTTTGTAEWHYVDSISWTGSGPIVANGLVYYSNGFGDIDAVDLSGNLKAQFLSLSSFAPVVSDGLLFVLDDADIYAFGP